MCAYVYTYRDIHLSIHLYINSSIDVSTCMDLMKRFQISQSFNHLRLLLLSARKYTLFVISRFSACLQPMLMFTGFTSLVPFIHCFQHLFQNFRARISGLLILGGSGAQPFQGLQGPRHGPVTLHKLRKKVGDCFCKLGPFSWVSLYYEERYYLGLH